MTYTQDINETTIYTVLRAFVQSVIGTSAEVIRVPTNRVPMPKSYPFVTMSPIYRGEIAWPTVSIPSSVSQSAMMPTEYRVQLDVFGPTAGDLTQQLHTVLQTADAWDFFAAQSPGGVYPIYADTPRQMTFVDSEEEMAVRWMMDLHLQYNPTLTNTVQTASTVTVNPIVNVEATYH